MYSPYTSKRINYRIEQPRSFSITQLPTASCIMCSLETGGTYRSVCLSVWSVHNSYLMLGYLAVDPSGISIYLSTCQNLSTVNKSVSLLWIQYSLSLRHDAQHLSLTQAFTSRHVKWKKCRNNVFQLDGFIPKGVNACKWCTATVPCHNIAAIRHGMVCLITSKTSQRVRNNIDWHNVHLFAFPGTVWA